MTTNPQAAQDVTRYKPEDVAFIFKGTRARLVRAKDYDALQSSNAERIATLEHAASALLKKLDVIEADPRYQSVWIMSANHGVPYTGPNYESEKRALQNVIDAARSGERGEETE